MKCRNPIFLKAAGGIAPCRQCFPCRLDNRRRKTFRILQEAQCHASNIWFSLTYSDDFCPREVIHPITGEITNGLPTLDFRDTELFLKRVRKALPVCPYKRGHPDRDRWLRDNSIRYFLCGEYGEKNQRPHYHVFFFNASPDIMPIIRDAWSHPITGEPYGRVRLDAPYVNYKNAQYTAGYTVKKMTKSDDPRLSGRIPEDTRESKGIGKYAIDGIFMALGGKSGLDYINEYKDVPRVVRFADKSWPLDRYFREKLLEKLQITDDAKKEGLKKFHKEMFALSLRAELNPKFSAARQMTPTTQILQYLEENSQAIRNIESKAKLMSKKETM